MTANYFDWNAHSLHGHGKVQEFTHEVKRYQWDILGLAEVRWTGFGETTTYYGEDSKHQYWVTFIIWKEVVGCIISCTPISSRLISIRISTRTHSITVIQVYAPTSDHDDEEVEQFCEQLDSILTKTPKKDIYIIASGLPKQALTHTNTGQRQ